MHDSSRLLNIAKLSFMSIVLIWNLNCRAEEKSESATIHSENSQTTSDINNTDSTRVESIKLIRPKYTDELNKESSSFVADPDSLDPLPLKKESLKDDEEPVLDDIKAILKTQNKSLQTENKTPKKKKIKTQKSTQNSNIAPVKNIKTVETVKITSAPKKQKKKALKKSKYAPNDKPSSDKKIVNAENEKKDVDQMSQLNDDAPDYLQEQKFHNLYQKFNNAPTPQETWVKALASDQNIKTYVVQKGDTLASISETLFGDVQFWPKIWALNQVGITNPHHIFPGQKIFFLEGTAETAPVVQVGDSSDLGLIVQKQLPPETNKFGKQSDSLGKYDVQNTEFNSNDKLLNRDKKKTNVYNEPPDSFPRTFPSKYLTPLTPSVTVLDFENKKMIDKPIENPYLLSSNRIKTDLQIKTSDLDKLVCRKGHYMPSIVEVDSQAGEQLSEKEYFMLVREDLKLTRLKNTFVYRRNGLVKMNSNGSMRVEQCIENSNSDVILVTADSLSAQILPPTEVVSSIKSGNRILDGFVVYGQSFFTKGQFVLLNADRGDLQKEQEYHVFSEEFGQNVGVIKVVEKTGTIALGFITQSSNLVKNGDSIVQ